MSLLFVAAAFFFLGELCASLVSVVTKEGATIFTMMRLEQKLLKCIGQGSKVPHTVEELVASGICDEAECRDAWGRMFEITPEGDSVIRLTSFGDPAIQKLDPEIKFTLSRIISCQSKTADAVQFGGLFYSHLSARLQKIRTVSGDTVAGQLVRR